MTVTVGDLDMAGQSSCPVTMTSSAGDSEALSLSPMGGGIFTGSIPTSGGLVVAGDGTVETVPGGTITATYHDVGDSTTVTAQATTTSSLALTVPPNATEGAGTVDGTIAMAASLGYAQVVDLASSDSTRAMVPATITIPAGQTSAKVPITIIDDGLLDGPEQVTFTAAASGYTSVTAPMNVHDYHTAVLTLTVPATANEAAGVLVGAGTVTSSAAPAAISRCS